MTEPEVTEEEINELLDRHAEWLRERTLVAKVGDWVEITTPYLDRHNDALQLYVKRDNGSLLITDDGYILSDLGLSGVNVESPKRRSLLQMAVNGLGVTLEGGKLVARATPDTFALKKQSILQAALAVNDLFYLSEPSVASLFLEDVEGWLKRERIRYVPNITVLGRSGYAHTFDFAIPASDAQPERLIRAISNPDKQAAELLIFTWNEAREVRENAQAYALLNDRDRQVPLGVTNALRKYEINPVPWQERASVREKLAA